MALAGEMVGCGRKSAVRSLPQRRLGRMKHNAPVRDIVGDLHTGGPGVVIVKFPRPYGAVVAGATRNLDHAGRPHITPGKLLLTRPDDFDGLPCSLRQPRSFDRVFARVLSTVSRTCVRYNHAHALLRNAESRS